MAAEVCRLDRLRGPDVAGCFLTRPRRPRHLLSGRPVRVDRRWPFARNAGDEDQPQLLGDDISSVSSARRVSHLDGPQISVAAGFSSYVSAIQSVEMVSMDQGGLWGRSRPYLSLVASPAPQQPPFIRYRAVVSTPA